MSAPFSYSRRLKPYAQQVREREQLIDEQRRARNRLIVACLLVALAVVAGWAWGML